MSGIGIMDGSLVLVRQCDSITSGKIAVVMIDQEVTVKTCLSIKKGNDDSRSCESRCRESLFYSTGNQRIAS